MSATVSFSDLFTYSAGNSSVHLPLAKLDQSAGHIHGLLEICIGSRALPYMGYFGPNDVCFNTWVEELVNILHALGPSRSASYVFDEGEQGQPAFEFKRDGEQLLVSVIESQLSGTAGDSSYQQVACTWPEFCAAVESFIERLRDTVLRESPHVGRTWLAKHAQRAA